MGKIQCRDLLLWVHDVEWLFRWIVSLCSGFYAHRSYFVFFCTPLSISFAIALFITSYIYISFRHRRLFFSLSLSIRVFLRAHATSNRIERVFKNRYLQIGFWQTVKYYYYSNLEWERSKRAKVRGEWRESEILIIRSFDHYYSKCDLLWQIEQDIFDNKTTHVFLLYFICMLGFFPFLSLSLFHLFNLFAIVCFSCSFHSNHIEQMKCDTGTYDKFLFLLFFVYKI